MSTITGGLDMLYLLAGVAFGGYFAFTFIKEFFVTKKKTDALLETHKDMVKVDHSMSMKIMSLMMIVVGVVAITLNDSASNMDLNRGLGVAMILMAMGQFYSCIYQNTYYYNETGMILNGNYIRYKSMKEIIRGKTFMQKGYDIVTFSGDKITITHKTAVFAKEKLKK